MGGGNEKEHLLGKENIAGKGFLRLTRILRILDNLKIHHVG